MAQAASPIPCEPTLEQRLRFIDLSFECAKAAKKLHPAPPRYADEWRPRDHAFEATYSRMRLEAMEREGLPLSLLGDGKTASERHFEKLAALTGDPVAERVAA
jgi:hypothetical protein